MNISMPLIKVIGLVAIIVLSSLIANYFLVQNKQLLNSKVPEAERSDLIEILKGILEHAYFSEEQQSLSIVNLGNSKIKIEVYDSNFSIILPSEKFSWRMGLIIICLSDRCNASTNEFYSIGHEVIHVNDGSLIPTVNISVNITNENNLKIYNIFITQMTSKPLLISGEVKIKIETERYYEKIIRTFLNRTTIDFELSNNIFYSYPIDEKSIVIFHLYKIILSISATNG